MISKILLYLSGVTGGSLLLAWFIGVAVEYPKTNLLLIFGFSFLVIIYLPMLIYSSYRQRKRIKHIIENSAKKESGIIPGDASEPGMKGWNMNNSPFRRRKSGLTWGGGNIHAANAERGTRRTFLKRGL